MDRDKEKQTQTPTAADAELSVAYRTAATESVPRELDQAVLALAHKSVRSANHRRWSFSLLRPLTIAATIGVSLAIVLQLGDYAVDDPAEPVVGIDRPSPKSSPGQTQSNKRLPVQAGGIAESHNSAQDAALTQQAEDSRQATTGRHCDTDQTNSADLWLACIERLQQNGRTDAATLERELLLREFPEPLDSE